MKCGLLNFMRRGVVTANNSNRAMRRLLKHWKELSKWERTMLTFISNLLENMKSEASLLWNSSDLTKSLLLLTNQKDLQKLLWNTLYHKLELKWEQSWMERKKRRRKRKRSLIAANRLLVIKMKLLCLTRATLTVLCSVRKISGSWSFMLLGVDTAKPLNLSTSRLLLSWRDK